jgi:hypothetical protein
MIPEEESAQRLGGTECANPSRPRTTNDLSLNAKIAEEKDKPRNARITQNGKGFQYPNPLLSKLPAQPVGDTALL